ncbi:Capsular polysaccharide biosynthesis protein [Actinomyces denticolens]|uniref:Capsular polysaccharide biosynthesis protein n=1 Tax=Actinomyces denticolens TaxID=52767 RepID=A0ABY1IH40_9ACTO|nr:Wzz/FepE/Etk N-terminal domain-containing protein [Actinomyces denticolens]SHJ16715.1 Capsular polysaccharide biosynthesis protein [Actinomyces denticolens]
MEPADILRLLRRHAPILILHIVLGAVAGLSFAMMSTPVYSSHASVVVSTSSRDSNGQDLGSASGQNSLLMPTLVELGTTQAVLNEVAASTGLDPAAVKGMLMLTARENTLFIDITANAPSADQAQAVVDAEIDAFKKAVSKWGYKDGQSLSLEEQDPATLPSAPISPIPGRYALNGALIGTAIGAAIVILMRRAGLAGRRGESRRVAEAVAPHTDGSAPHADGDPKPAMSVPSPAEDYTPPPASSELFPPSMRHRR